MAGVDHDHLVAGPFREARFLAVGAHDVGELLLREGLDRPAVGPHPVAGAPLAEGGLPVLIGHIGPGILAGMGQFDARHGPVATNPVGHEGVGRQAARRLQVQVQHVAAVRLRMDHQLADGHSRGAALGAQLIEALDAGARAAVGGDIRGAHRRGEHPVAEDDPADLDRTGQERIAVEVHTFIFVFRKNRKPPGEWLGISLEMLCNPYEKAVN